MTPQEAANSAIAQMHPNDLSQIMSLHRGNSAFLGCNGSNPIDMSTTRLYPSSVGLCMSAEAAFESPNLSSYPECPLPLKDVAERQESSIYNQPSTVPQFMSAMGIHSDGMHFHRLEGVPGDLMPHERMLRSRVYSCPSSYPCLQQSLSTNGPSMESLDSRTGFEQGTDRGMSLGRRVVSDAYDEKQSSTEKCSGSSRGSSGTRLRWKPNANQIELLERTFEKGLRRATPELHSAIQGCGHATEHNVNVWLKNRTSRHKKVQSKTPVEKQHFQDSESDDDHLWEDFNEATNAVMTELTQSISGVDRNDTFRLSQAIQDAKRICCFGSGKQALAIKGFAFGLHHLGYDVFFMDDTNSPEMDHESLVIICAGPGSGGRISGMIEEALQARSRVIVFATYKLADSRIDTIVIPAQPQGRLGLGSDSEGISSLSDASQETLTPSSLFDLSLIVLCECVCVILRKASDIHPSEIRARHTNLE